MCCATWLVRQVLITSGRGSASESWVTAKGPSCCSLCGSPRKASPEGLRSSGELPSKSRAWRTRTRSQQVFTSGRSINPPTSAQESWTVPFLMRGSVVTLTSLCPGDQSLSLYMGSLYPRLLLRANSPHCPAYHQLALWRRQACERGQEETKAAVKGREVRAALFLSLFYFKGPSGPCEASRHRAGLPTGPGAVSLSRCYSLDQSSLPAQVGTQLIGWGSSLLWPLCVLDQHTAF